MRKNTLQVAILNAILLMGGAMTYPATAYAQGQAQTYSIAGGDLETVLSRFGTESRIQLIYPPELLKGKRSSGLTGSHTPTEALRLLLEGSGLVAERVNDKTVVIKKGAAPAAEPKAAPRDNPKTTQVKEAEVEELETVTVTGTRIRGGTTPSPTIVMGEEQFQQEGFTDLGEVIRSIPQNFRGGQNPGVNVGATAGSATNRNNSGGSALNLRGLGPDASLTLLNGRRLSYDSTNQAVDISAIPIQAVERIEIVPDGASAIYGSDAVGGVANVILKRDFEGVALGALYGDSTDGGLERQEFNAAVGETWDSGGFIGTFTKSSQDPLFADQRDYTQSMADPATLYNGSKLRSGLVSAYQRFGERAELRLDMLRTVRDASSFESSATQNFAGSWLSTITSVAPSLELSLAHDWSLTVGASRSKGENVFDTVTTTGGVATTSANGCYCNETMSWELGAEGSLVSFGSRDMRLAIGIGGRRDEFANKSFLTNTNYEGEQRGRYAYGELSLPLIGADNARPGAQRLEFSAAVRAEDYDTFGGVTTPKLGVIYDPNRDFTLKASWGRSFKVPTLNQRVFNRFTYVWRAQQVGCTSCAADETVLMSFGGNRDLEPERARTWTASLAFHPEALPGLDAELTFFSIDYTQRVAYPFPNVLNSLRNPEEYASFIQYGPTIDQQQELIATYNDAFYNQSGLAYDPNKVVAIVSAQYTNVASQQAKGFDLTGSFRFDLPVGQLVFRGGASWIDLSQQNISGQDAFDLSGTVYFPAEINSRLGAIWSYGGLSISAFANYTSGITNTITATREEIGSITTFDSTLRYETAPGSTPLSGLTLALSVDNLFNRDPPIITQPNPRYAPFDSTNHSAIGRYITVSISKHW
ncbi:TonB-dependent receptor [Pseudoxanthomonas putridarboris]|uniref:TonB-dependent receptor n=1 Tax=Pseudoxanthomonas putridarboris TaxID=752605 RepID=A0ABU9IV57_9GAMM